jgi:hypothetical protein
VSVRVAPYEGNSAGRASVSSQIQCSLDVLGKELEKRGLRLPLRGLIAVYVKSRRAAKGAGKRYRFLTGYLSSGQCGKKALRALGSANSLGTA